MLSVTAFELSMPYNDPWDPTTNATRSMDAYSTYRRCTLRSLRLAAVYWTLSGALFVYAGAQRRRGALGAMGTEISWGQKRWKLTT